MTKTIATNNRIYRLMTLEVVEGSIRAHVVKELVRRIKDGTLTITSVMTLAKYRAAVDKLFVGNVERQEAYVLWRVINGR